MGWLCAVPLPAWIMHPGTKEAGKGACESPESSLLRQDGGGGLYTNIVGA